MLLLLFLFFYFFRNRQYYRVVILHGTVRCETIDNLSLIDLVQHENLIIDSYRF